MQRCRARGLTIGELVVATGLLSLMVVTVMVLFGQMLDATSKNALVSQGSFFAETVIEREIYSLAKYHQDPAHAAAPRNDVGSDWISFTDETNQTEFSYHVDSIPAGIVAGVDMGFTYSIQVEVRWWQSADGAAQNRKGFGKMYLKRSRIAYVPKP